MHYPETSEAASKFVLLALKRTKELGISANPIHFTVWYEYFAGKNSNLNSSVDALMSIDGKLDEGSCTDLYDRFIIAGANSARDKEWSDRIEAVTERLVDVLTATGSEAEKIRLSPEDILGWNTECRKRRTNPGTRRRHN